MKKSFVLLLAFIILISGTVSYAQNELLKEKDQVHFTEHIIYGDKSVVEGVTIDAYNTYQNHLFWHTTYEVGEVPKESTAYEFYSSSYWDNAVYTGGSMDIINYSNCPTVSGYMVDKEYFGLEAAMKELYDETEPGEENVKQVYLKDYMEYYSFGWDLELPKEEGKTYTPYCEYHYFSPGDLDEEIAKLEASDRNAKTLEQLKKCKKDLENFQEFFKIPVLETEIYMIALAKDEKGSIIASAESGLGGGTSTGNIDFPEMPWDENLDSFRFGMYYVFDNGDCFFTFDPLTTQGNPVDTSLIPGGYGIYHITYDSEKGEIDSEHIQMVYSMEPTVELSQLCLDASGKNILLETIENGRIYLSVIARDTMTLQDKFDVGDAESYFTFWTFEDYMVTCGDTLAVYTTDGKGHYTKEFAVDTKAIDEIIDVYEHAQNVPGDSSSFDWNGETLLIGNYIYYATKGRSTDFMLAAIDETGLLYYGVYESTLNTSDTQYAPCDANSNKVNPVVVKWRK